MSTRKLCAAATAILGALAMTAPVAGFVNPGPTGPLGPLGAAGPLGGTANLPGGFNALNVGPSGPLGPGGALGPHQ